VPHQSPNEHEHQNFEFQTPSSMFVVLQGCHSGRFTLPYILWKSSHFDSMTTSFLYLTYLPHPTQKKKPWSSSMHEYHVPKIVCHNFGSSQINGKGSIMYIPNIIVTSQSFPTFIQKFDLGWCFESCNGCKGKWFENNWVDIIKNYKTELWH